MFIEEKYEKDGKKLLIVKERVFKQVKSMLIK